MDIKERRMIDDAIWDLSHDYPLAALSILRALAAGGVPKVLLTPMPRHVRNAGSDTPGEVGHVGST